MKYKTWMKQYCTICINKMVCELNWKKQIKDTLKYFATGAMDSQDKLWRIKRNASWKTSQVKSEPILDKEGRKQYPEEIMGVKDITCLVFARISHYRLQVDKATLKKQIKQLVTKRNETHEYINDLKGVMRTLKGVKK